MMKKNKAITKEIKEMFLLTLSLILVSCGSFQGISYYGDGIYGEELPIEPPKIITYVEQENSPIHYKSFFNEIAEKANKIASPTNNLRDIETYQPTTNRTSQKKWKQNTTSDNITINVYDNYYNRWEYDPFYDWNYRNNYFWGIGAWSPYYQNNWRYYGPSNRINFGFSWGYNWNYPYYMYDPYYYEYTYRPYYYGYYNPYYYSDRYYPHYNSKNQVYVKGRREGNMDYSSPKNIERRSEYHKSYSRQNNNVTPNRTYSRSARESYTPSNNSNTYSRNSVSPTYSRTYERSDNSSSRSYNRTSSPSSGRSYSRSHRGD